MASFGMKFNIRVKWIGILSQKIELNNCWYYILEFFVDFDQVFVVSSHICYEF